jgi:peptidoglycan-associated lipoprotein
MEEVRVTEPAVPPLLSAPAPTQAAPAPTQTAPGNALAGLADVFFDFARATIRNDGMSVLEADAIVLKGENGWKLLISGHCDERGTQAYNLVLGERRAQSVKRYLGDLGLAASRIEVVSYGKEKPFCTEHNQQCWQMNRRAHLQKQSNQSH